jgi:hypothetical protein
MRGAPTEVREVALEDMLSRLHFATTRQGFSMLDANSTRDVMVNQLRLLF